MTQCSEILGEVSRHLAILDAESYPDPFFRGHSDGQHPLEPELARNKEWNETVEDRIYCRFRELGGYLMPQGITTWDILFLMRHHNLPTRLLDWTENFSVALYFALKNCSNEAAVWILNPYKLNQMSYEKDDVYNLNITFPEGYLSYFLDSTHPKYKKFPASILAVEGSTILARMQWQRSVFTLHSDLSSSLDKAFPAALKKFTIPHDLIQNAKEFLHLTGMNLAYSQTWMG